MKKDTFDDRYKEFWEDILLAILKQIDKDPDLFKNIYFMSGMLQAAAEILKNWNQEMIPGFTPELQEKIDKRLKIFMRMQSAGSLDKIFRTSKK